MEFISFYQPQWLKLLWLIPVFLLSVFCSWQHFHRFESWLKRWPYRYKANLPPWRCRVAKAVFYSLGLALTALALADPYYKKSVPENVYENVRIYFLFDISRSMEMAEDVEPNRLEAAKREIRAAYDSFEGAYEVSIVPFAGRANAYYYPPSFDSVSFFMALDYLDGDVVPVAGSDLVSAFMALNQLVEDFGLRANTTNIAILLSDGGKEESFAVDRYELQNQIRLLVNRGFGIYAVGIGGLQPTPLVVRDWAGNFRGYLRDSETDHIYTSQLDESVLRFIADSGGGRYVRFERGGELAEAIRDIIEENRELLEVRYRQEEQSARLWFFLAGILIFLLGETHLRR